MKRRLRSFRKFCVSTISGFALSFSFFILIAFLRAGVTLRGQLLQEGGVTVGALTTKQYLLVLESFQLFWWWFWVVSIALVITLHLWLFSG